MTLLNRETPRSESPTPDTSPWASLRDRNYRLFWVGGLVSHIGRWFQSVAIPAIIWQLTDSAGWVGFAGFATVAPMALMSPVGGALADRFDRRRLLFATQLLQAAATALLMVMWMAGVRAPEVYVGLSALAGMFSGLNLPGWKAFVADLVDRDRLLNAVALTSMQFNTARMIGPALAGITLAAAGPAWAFFINLISFGAVLAALAMIDVHVPRPAAATRPFTPVRDFVDTVTWIRGHAGIRRAIMAAGLVGLLGMPIQVLAVVFAEDVFGRGATTYGLMLTMIGLGAVATGPFIAGKGTTMVRSRLESFALVAYAIGILVFAAAPVLPVAFVALLLVGSAHTTSASVLNTAIQLQVPEARRAKVLSVHVMVITMSSPVGQLVLGQMIDRFGARPTIIGGGALMLSLAAWFIATRRLGSLDDD